jgi:hypothetical protein
MGDDRAKSVIEDQRNVAQIRQFSKQVLTSEPIDAPRE